MDRLGGLLGGGLRLREPQGDYQGAEGRRHQQAQGHLPGEEPTSGAEFPAIEFEDRWTGAYIFENEWQSFRTRQKRSSN